MKILEPRAGRISIYELKFHRKPKYVLLASSKLDGLKIISPLQEPNQVYYLNNQILFIIKIYFYNQKILS